MAASFQPGPTHGSSGVPSRLAQFTPTCQYVGYHPPTYAANAMSGLIPWTTVSAARTNWWMMRARQAIQSAKSGPRTKWPPSGIRMSSGQDSSGCPSHSSKAARLKSEKSAVPSGKRMRSRTMPSTSYVRATSWMTASS